MNKKQYMSLLLTMVVASFIGGVIAVGVIDSGDVQAASKGRYTGHMTGDRPTVIWILDTQTGTANYMVGSDTFTPVTLKFRP